MARQNGPIIAIGKAMASFDNVDCVVCQIAKDTHNMYIDMLWPQTIHIFIYIYMYINNVVIPAVYVYV